MKKFSMLIILFFTVVFSHAQQLSFPGAEGGGAYTTGGRGGKTLFVTNLNDSGQGSLRWAIEQNYPRMILFKVSGTIFLESSLKITSGNLTIAGQSAPGDGICVANYSVEVRASNVVIRFMRFRMGDLKKYQGDALGGTKMSDIMIDHCSTSWATDENCSFYGNANFTLQWSILSEPLNFSVHNEGQHGKGGIWGGKDATFHHNLLAHNNDRNPRFDHPGVYIGQEIEMDQQRGNVECRNNVVYNWGRSAAYGGEGGKFNFMNNYYKAGGATRDKKIFFEPYIQSWEWGKFYLAGNVLESFPAATQNNDLGVKPKLPDKNSSVELRRILVNKPFEIKGVPMTDHTAKECFDLVVKYAGASYMRDAIDTRITDEVRNGKTTYTGVRSKMPGIIDSQTEVGGWVELKSAPVPKDSDKDGIPDEWEVKHNLDPNDPSDAVKLMQEGYTNLEVYLNSLVDHIVKAQNVKTLNKKRNNNLKDN